MPEAQRAFSGKHCELLIKRAVAIRLVVHETTETIRRIANESGERATMRLHVCHNGGRVLIQNDPGRERSGFESAVLDKTAIAGRGSRRTGWRRGSCCGWCGAGCSCRRCCWCWRCARHYRGNESTSFAPVPPSAEVARGVVSTGGIASILREISVIAFNADHQLAGVGNRGRNDIDIDELERRIAIFK